MISEWFLTFAGGVADWFLGLLGTEEPPEWLTDVPGFITEMFARVEGLGAWFPFALLATIVVGLLGWQALFWIVKGIRWLWGLTPFSGGS